MGCGDSKELKAQIEQLNQEVELNKVRAREQQNLLRFKVEVLVNMLAVEEKRNEEQSKRIETMQWLLTKEGLNEETLGQILVNLDSKTKEKFHTSIADARFGERSLLPDVGTVVDKMRDEFNNELKRDDVLHAFSRSDGKIVSVVPTETFVKQICEVTETLTPLDAKVLAIRFDDGTGGYVSVTEFIDFFITPPSVRTARVAASAVRMSLELFSLNVELLDNINEKDPELVLTQEELDLLPAEMRKSHFTDILDRGAKRLLVMWPVVRDELKKNLDIFAKKNEIEKVIEIDIFQNALLAYCSQYSTLLEDLERDGKITIKKASTTAVDVQVNGKPNGDVGDATKKMVKRDSNASNAGDQEHDTDKENKDSNGSPVPPPKLSTSPSSSSVAVSTTAPNTTIKPPKTPAPADADAAVTTATNANQTPGNAQSNTDKATLIVEPLDEEDISFISERFELSGMIHYGYFLDFFDSTFKRFLKYKRKFKNLPPDEHVTGISPFTYSSEWNALKASSILRKSKDQIRKSVSARSIERKPSESVTTPAATANAPPKVFTAPKQLPPRTAEKPKAVVIVEPPQSDKSPEPVAVATPPPVETPAAIEDNKKEKEEEKVEEPPKAEEKKDEGEKKEDEKAQEPPATPAPASATEPVKTAPVVSQSKCFLCSLGKSEPKTVDPPAIADSKAGMTPPVRKDTPLHKQVTIDIDTPPEKESKDVAESKADLPPMKQSESPRAFPRTYLDSPSESSGSDDGRFLPNRAGLGRGRNDDTPLVPPKSRFRKREGQDYSREKSIIEDPEEMEEEDHRYGGRK